jgi:osmotically-inducible protein OsmY
MKPIALFASLSFLVCGCSQQQMDKAQDAIASDAPKLANDGLIFAQVESKLVAIDPNSALHVAVSAHDGDVRLSGRVKSGDVEKKYVQATTGISGVKHVNATMTVDPKLPSATKDADDFALAAAVRVKVAAQAGVNGFGLGITARGGTVTLSGRVPTSAIHETVVATAKGTQGVSAVVDHLHDGS